MKKIKLLLTALCFSVWSYAQVPQAMNYQGVARDKDGHAFVNKQMELRISIIDGAETGKPVYVETHKVSTNQFGLYNLHIGEGNATNGMLKDVAWQTNNKFIKVEVLENGAYADLGTTQLLSVPYAMYAQSAGSTAGGASTDKASRGGTSNYLSKFDATGSSSAEINSQLSDNGTSVGLNTLTPSAKLHVYQNALSSNILVMEHRDSVGFGRFSMWNDKGFANRATFTRYGSKAPGMQPGSTLFPDADLLAFGCNKGSFLISTAGDAGVQVLNSGIMKLRLMVEDSTGNVGIGGNAFPQNTLHVNSETANDSIRITNLTTGHTKNDGLLLGNNGNAAFLTNRENDVLTLGTNNLERIRIAAAGNVGVNVIPSLTTGTRMEVQGGTSSTAIHGEATAPYGAGKTVTSSQGTSIFPNAPVFNESIGVFGKGNTTAPGSNGNSYGVVGSATNSAATNNVGVFGEAGKAGGYNTAVGGVILGGTTANVLNAAIRGDAPLTPSNTYAGYFNGKVGIVDGTQGAGKVLTSDAAGKASWQTPAAGGPSYTAGTGINVTGTVISNTGDLSNTNEIQAISLSGSTLSLSAGGGSVVLPAAPVYTGSTGINVTGTAITNTGDLSNTNEIQAISLSGSTLSLSAGGGSVVLPAAPVYTGGTGISVTGTTVSNTGDLSNTNEIQTLSLSGTTLSLSAGGGSITLPSGGGTLTGSGTLNYLPKWTPTGTALGNSQIFDNGANIGVGTAAPSAGFHVKQDPVAPGKINGIFRFERANSNNQNNATDIVHTTSAFGSTNNLLAGGSTVIRNFNSSASGSWNPDMAFSANTTDPHLVINNNGNVGIGLQNPSGNLVANAKLEVANAAKTAGLFTSTNATGTNPIVLQGEYLGADLTTNYTGVAGISSPSSANATGIGVSGAGGLVGVIGQSTSSDASNGNYGSVGLSTNDADATGMYAVASSVNGISIGVEGNGTGGSHSLGGRFTGDNIGAQGIASVVSPVTGAQVALLPGYNGTIGLLGKGLLSNGTFGDINYGVVGSAIGDNFINIGMVGEANGNGNNYGLLGFVDGSTSNGVNFGVFANGDANFNSIGVQNVGVYSVCRPNPATTIPYTPTASQQYLAGYFDGDVVIDGGLNATSSTSGTKFFTIDHPLDPKNKILRHSSVESPDMMNIYNGNIITDANGKATVTMPAYFEALNQDFRYQLTVIDQTQFAQARIAKKMGGNQFEIITDKPNIEISWQVTGVRHDAVAQKYGMPIEQDKSGKEVGKYIYPNAYADGAEQAAERRKSLEIPGKKSATSVAAPTPTNDVQIATNKKNQLLQKLNKNIKQ
jgi:trimeric autotransporter adhesin